MYQTMTILSTAQLIHSFSNFLTSCCLKYIHCTANQYLFPTSFYKYRNIYLVVLLSSGSSSRIFCNVAVRLTIRIYESYSFSVVTKGLFIRQWFGIQIETHCYHKLISLSLCVGKKVYVINTTAPCYQIYFITINRLVLLTPKGYPFCRGPWSKDGVFAFTFPKC